MMEQLQQGKSADQIRHYMVERYGDFILYRTPIKKA
ncbi:cytochrome c-type biogenesis protein CcmH, partial [Vibrio cholerae]